MKNLNELTLNQIIILENEYNHIYLEINDIKNDMIDNGSSEKKTLFLSSLENKLNEVKTICRLFDYDVVMNKLSGLYSLCER